jgi:hypothetical protein
MVSSRSFVGLSLLSLISSSVAQLYVNPDIYDTTNFFSKFNFASGDDPTHGYVDYQTQAGAVTNNLISTGASSVKFGADFSKVASGRGRMSVRLEGKTTYTHGLFIADIKHMPQSACGAWPSFWTLGPSWPTNGEIDILENVNFQTTNQYALHTGGGSQGACNVKAAPQNGTLLGTGCAVYDPSGAYSNPTGCAITSGASGTSFGDGFNNIGGGVIAMQWTSAYIKIWFFPRNNIPSSLQSASSSPDICQFGRPDATYQGDGCSFDSNFAQQQIVFTNTFCGDWGKCTITQNIDFMTNNTSSWCQWCLPYRNLRK